MAQKTIDLAIFNDNSNLYYYTGSVQPLYLFVPLEGAPFIIARKAIDRIQEEVSHIQLEVFNSTQDLKKIIANRLNGVKRIGFTLDTTTYATIQRWQYLFEGTEFADLSWDARLLRSVKSETEIAIYERAGKIVSEVPRIVRDNFHSGMTELELSAAIEYYFRLNGHNGIVRCHSEAVEMNNGVCSGGINALAGTKFNGVCAGTGTSAAVPYGAGNRPIVKGEPVVLDYAFNLEGYTIDQTRMFSWGDPAKSVIAAYQAMLRVEDAVIEELRPGKSWSEVYERAEKLAEELGYAHEFMGCGPEKVRFVGHGVGLELDEPPFLAPKMDYPLQEGMIIAVEPKVALPGIGVVGPEDTLYVTASGTKRLTLCSRDYLIIS